MVPAQIVNPEPQSCYFLFNYLLFWLQDKDAIILVFKNCQVA